MERKEETLKCKKKLCMCVHKHVCDVCICNMCVVCVSLLVHMCRGGHCVCCPVQLYVIPLRRGLLLSLGLD